MRTVPGTRIRVKTVQIWLYEKWRKPRHFLTVLQLRPIQQR